MPFPGETQPFVLEEEIDVIRESQRPYLELRKPVETLKGEFARHGGAGIC